MAPVGRRPVPSGRKAARGDAHGAREAAALAVRIDRPFGYQELHHQPTGVTGAIALRAHDHAGGDPEEAARLQRAVAFDLDDAQPAISVGPEVRLGGQAGARDLNAVALRHVPDCLARTGGDLLSVEGERDGAAHDDLSCICFRSDGGATVSSGAPLR